MKLVTEIVDEKDTALIINKTNSDFVNLLKHELKNFHLNVFLSPVLPKNNKKFKYIFLVNANYLDKNKFEIFSKNIFLIFINKDKLANQMIKNYQSESLKIISLKGDNFLKNHIDQIIWFLLSQSKEKILRISNSTTLPSIKKRVLTSKYSFSISRKKLILISLILLITLHLIFIFPLCLSSYFIFRSVDNLKNEKYAGAAQEMNRSIFFLSFAKTLYFLPRQTFLMFSLALIPDGIFDVEDKAETTIQDLLSLKENTDETIKLILKQNKSPEDKSTLILRLDKIKSYISDIQDNLIVITQKLPSFTSQLKDLKNNTESTYELISQFKKILPYMDSFFAKNTEKKYLLLFANNMELRPGGGFIGSFGILTLKDYTLTSIKIYDVYDADGQLYIHVDPPTPIRTFFNQPNWFLRDSAFSPDFLDNYIQAKTFLAKELQLNDFSGGIMLTTTAIQNILGAFGNIYLPDFNENINPDNFYIKAQVHSEKDFFPGSIQKKNFLGDLAQYLLLNLNNASIKNMVKQIRKSLNEKQIVLYFDDPKFEEVLNSYYWSGRVIDPKCALDSQNCIVDYLFPFDANLGVNKANFYVTRTYDLGTSVDKNGQINHVFSVQFNNNSTLEDFPGGSYKNYFQVYLPKDSIIKQITRDGTLVESYDEKDDNFKEIGIFFEVPPKTITEIKINYSLKDTLKQGDGIYQFIVQKQIGAQNSDISLRLFFPPNISIGDNNFFALVNNQQIIYNTTLSDDKIFFVELNKK